MVWDGVVDTGGPGPERDMEEDMEGRKEMMGGTDH